MGVILGDRNNSESLAANEALNDSKFMARPNKIPYISGEASSVETELAADPAEADGQDDLCSVGRTVTSQLGGRAQAQVSVALEDAHRLDPKDKHERRLEDNH